ncbi:MAG: Hsp20/alpha crystallin family protein [Anaerolineae bacterium]
MSLINQHLARDLMAMREMMNRLNDAVWGSTESGGSRVARLPIDAYSTENEIVITAAVPGVNPDDVEITLEGDTLTIQGEIKSRLENTRYLINERFDGRFARTLQLNVPVEMDKAEATFENGVLTLVLPKAEEVRPRTIQVKAR